MIFIGLISFIITTLLTTFLIVIQKKLSISQFIRSEGPKQHLDKKGTPTLGGMSLATAQCVSLMPLTKNPIVVFYLKALILFFLLGLLDDIIKINKIKNGISARLKMFIQLIIASYLIISMPILAPAISTYIPMIGWLQLPFLIWLVLNLGAYAGTTNAINLTDGLDGLLTLILLGVWTVMLSIMLKISSSLTPEQYSAASALTASNIGSLLSFLMFNSYRASIFMGDAGSMGLGGSLCSLFCIFNAPLLLIGTLIIPVLETISVILQVASYRLRGKRIFKMTPLHHHFEQSGYHESHITLRFFIINTCCFIMFAYSIFSTI
jgi:phospho-N-acetylmuramoyl-pentapeptide-transferase